ncbi:hypothetical protein Bhyg_11301 [Pseudolycoriella hygida]|uniref:Uncharacterized protein n=1 Tax=Pseudolycoriella hygida TaxID=35572 RepID=A0A9Q0MW05_9DIPT|nr:hypothetical protein Bhyg_11301 [Pseudolycoriella hygida]
MNIRCDCDGSGSTMLPSWLSIENDGVQCPQIIASSVTEIVDSQFASSTGVFKFNLFGSSTALRFLRCR